MVNSPTTRVTRSSHNDRGMGSIQAVESPSFSIGVGGGGGSRTTSIARRSRRNTSAVQAASPTNNSNRRSTRRTAQTARTIIAQELAPQRRSNRLAASKPDTDTNNTSSPAVVRRSNQPSRRIQASTTTNSPTNRRTTRTTTRKQTSSPIDLCDSSDDEDEMNLKPAAKTQSTIIAGASSLAVKPPPLEDITCPICLDTPSSMIQVARISGCSHKFCFNCIDKWADTENKCPLCKKRFNKIERVEPLDIKSERRGKRKRSTASTPGSNQRRRTSTASSPRNNSRINSRTVEDRNQELPSVQINDALIRQILASFTSQLRGGGAGGEGGPGAAGNPLTFGTDAEGRPSIRMRMPANGGANGDLLGMLEMIMPGPLPGGGRGRSTTSARSASSSSARRRASSSPGRRASSSPRAASNPFAPAPARFSVGSARSTTRGAAASRSSSTDRSSFPGAASAASGNAMGSGGNPESRAARQAESAFASLFAQIGQAAASGSGSRTSSSPRIRRGGTQMPQRAEAPGNGNPAHRVTIRINVRPPPQRAGSGAQASNSPAARARSSPARSPTWSLSRRREGLNELGRRSGGRRSNGSGSRGGSAGQGRGDEDDPIVID